ncbi:MAG: hypothetical protein O7A71_03625 [Chloroflexi bacterium]|nr:hypothetical protein [Chloroflexota bacterium]
MTEIAEAVLVLRTDDTALASGLARAERLTLEALGRIEAVTARANLTIDRAAVAAIATAVAATDSLSFSVGTLTRTGLSAATSVGALSVSVGTLTPTGLGAATSVGALIAALNSLAATGVAAAARIATAASTAASAAASLVSQAAALRASAQAQANESAQASDDAPPAQVPFLHRATRTFAATNQARALSTAPLVGTLNVTVERENPRAIQLGVERALQELATSAALAGSID